MNIIVDVNALISSLLKDSTSRTILVSSNQNFFFPEPSLQKIRKYQEYIREKTGFSKFEFMVVFHYLLRFIELIPTEEVLEHLDEAKRIMEHVDPEDVTIIAAALSKENSVIWSDDADFDKQTVVSVFKTVDMVRMFYPQEF